MNKNLSISDSIHPLDNKPFFKGSFQAFPEGFSPYKLLNSL